MAYCYIITLDNYYESRGACWKESQLENETIVGPHQGVPPAPWDLHIPSPPYFEDCIRSVPVPFTQVSRSCSSCSGSCEENCSTCSGKGSCMCSKCHGKQSVVCCTEQMNDRTVHVFIAMVQVKNVAGSVMEWEEFLVMCVVVVVLCYDGLI